MWEWFGVTRLGENTGRVYPTYVGMIRQIIPTALRFSGLSHVCGNDSWDSIKALRATLFIPRMWEWFVFSLRFFIFYTGLSHTCGNAVIPLSTQKTAIPITGTAVFLLKVFIEIFICYTAVWHRAAVRDIHSRTSVLAYYRPGFHSDPHYLETSGLPHPIFSTSDTTLLWPSACFRPDGPEHTTIPLLSDPHTPF